MAENTRLKAKDHAATIIPEKDVRIREIRRIGNNQQTKMNYRGSRMDKRELFQIRNIIREIECLQRQLEQAESLVEKHQTTAIVKGSHYSFPYTERSFRLSGADEKEYARKVKRLRMKLKHRIDELIKKVEEAQEYIESIKDSDTRLILQLRFINGLTWEQLEAETGIPMTTAKRKYRRWRDF
jgi:hypothetical protein